MPTHHHHDTTSIGLLLAVALGAIVWAFAVIGLVEVMRHHLHWIN